MNPSKHHLRLRAPVVLAAVAALWSAGALAQATDVKIGFAAPLTGGQAHYGADFRSGVQMAIDDENATNPTIGG
ncbi:MAG TPA: branched-chain amino acid ABC transporter substrate-binding protein, partial [Paraburkholderia sp.]